VRNFDVRTVNLPMADLGPKEDIQEHSSNKSVCLDVNRKVEDKICDKTDEAKVKHNEVPHYDMIGKKKEDGFFFKTGVPPKEMPGHTGYLTFATLYPS